ncbi:MAG: mandelate racemase, partial [Deltaproteobacteria bacterium]|nr:mandelate racemase [Deltaproteobacteria bacterium]
IKGKLLGVPCYELFGGPCRETVPCYGNYWFMKTKMGPTRVSEYAESAARAVEKGYKALKWSPFGYAAHSMTKKQENITVECVRQVRDAVGPDINLMVDAHGRFDLPQARRLAQRFEEFDLLFFEEPLPPENLDAYVELKRSTKTPIATGERYVARFQFRELLEKYCCDYIQPDAIYTGGMNELRKIAMMAETYYCPVVPHNCNGPVCTAASIHAAACMPNFLMLEYIPVPEREDVLVEPLVLKNGEFELPKKPGLGIELNKKVFKNYIFQPRDLDHFTPAREIFL